MRRRILMLSALAAGVSPALAQNPPVTGAAQVEVRQPWARATASAGQAGGAFMTLVSKGGADRLLSASSPIAATVELHETVRDGTVMRMRAVPVLVLEAGQPVELKPGSYHMMLSGLHRPLQRGESFPLTLIFEKAGAVTATVTVQAAGASGPGHGH